MERVGKRIAERLTTQGFFERNPQKGDTKGLILVVLLLGGLLFIAPALKAPYALIIIIPGFLLSIILLVLMPRRSLQGQAVHEHLMGLKLFIHTTQKDRLKMLQSPKAKYATNYAEPERTVDLFEKLLPFAIIFGLEKGWAKQFNDIYTQPPTWYSGNWGTFNAAMMASHISSSTQAMGATFTPPSSSGGSGFSGGGAGGGGGGGGGGGW